MNKSKNNLKLTDAGWALMRSTAPWMICVLWGMALPANSAPVANKQAAAVKQATPAKQSIPPCKSVQVGKSSVITMGKIEILPLSVKTKRIFVGGLPPGDASSIPDIGKSGGELKQTVIRKKSGDNVTFENVATVTPTAQTSASTGVADVDVVLLSPSQLYLLGKKNGTMNVILQGQDDQCTVMGVTVTMDAAALQDRLGQLIPGQKGIKVSAVENSFILTGTVSDAVKVNQAVTLANAYTGNTSGSTSGGNVINMLQVSAPQQVMLEVKMAEVSKNLLDKLGAQFNASRSNGGVAYAIASGFLALTGSASKGVLTITHNNTSITLDAQDKDGVVKILAEPNIIAISGQEGSFLAGGKIFIPISQTATGGLATVTLEEKEFGVGLRFTPTVLEDGLINLKVTPEVSELSQTGIAITSGSNSSILPSFTTRRASTTVQLRDGQSFAIAGLIKNNVTETITRFPILGNIPILGALFRSTEFQNDKTELLFVITPRLVKPLPPDYKLPTDNFIEPNKKEFFLGGKLEGKPAEPAAPAPMNPAPATPAPNGAKPESADPGGFEMK